MELGSLNDRTRSAIVAVDGGRVFVKANEVEHRHEAARYRALEGSAVPTARLLHAMVLPPVEILVLECLDRIGIDFESDSEVEELLRLCATLNSARPSVLPAAAGAGGSAADFDADSDADSAADFDAAVLSALGTVAGGEADRWWAAYQWAAAKVDAMPTALCHGEFYFQQVGWASRDGRPTLVVFDLETLAYRPRFADIASILYPLAERTGRSQEDLLAVYLEALGERTGVSVGVEVGVEAAFAELRVFRWVDACWGLPWLLRQHADSPESVPLELTLAQMRQDLARLDRRRQ